jgi:pimeloyl-ACP methyl ester carboxylesterase
MAPVARQLARGRGVLEPLQTAMTIAGQIEELQVVLAAHSEPPVTLIGHSWGAWLGYLLSARHPALVRKLILVGSGPFDEEYAAAVHETRLSRLSPAEREEFQSLVTTLADPSMEAPYVALARLGALASQADTYDPLPARDEPVTVQAAIFQGVWPEAAELRRSGQLLAEARRIQCPVVAIHGDYDPHPPPGVQRPLAAVLADFRFVLLPRCGHKPWLERHARDTFYQILEAELQPEPPDTPAPPGAPSPEE